jgi:CYTH domain-containing protein
MLSQTGFNILFIGLLEHDRTPYKGKDYASFINDVKKKSIDIMIAQSPYLKLLIYSKQPKGIIKIYRLTNVAKKENNVDFNWVVTTENSYKAFDEIAEVETYFNELVKLATKTDIPNEIERKFLIKKPTKQQIQALGCTSITTISQTYLVRQRPETERRVRMRGSEQKGYKYYYTEKTDNGKGSRAENEREISQAEYKQLLQQADTKLKPIHKTRYVFNYAGKKFEMDLYPFSDNYAVFEVELNSIDEPLKLPKDKLTIIKEVTDDKRYKNGSLTKTQHFPEDAQSQSIEAKVEAYVRKNYSDTSKYEIYRGKDGEYSARVIKKDRDKAKAFKKPWVIHDGLGAFADIIVIDSATGLAFRFEMPNVAAPRGDWDCNLYQAVNI